jgi:hypothetical protein
MASVGDCFDNSMAESFFATLQLELLDRRHWSTRAELASAIFEYIEAFYNPTRRHTSIGSLSPIDFEALHTAAEIAAGSSQPTCPDKRGKLTEPIYTNRWDANTYRCGLAVP